MLTRVEWKSACDKSQVNLDHEICSTTIETIEFSLSLSRYGCTSKRNWPGDGQNVCTTTGAYAHGTVLNYTGKQARPLHCWLYFGAVSMCNIPSCPRIDHVFNNLSPIVPLFLFIACLIMRMLPAYLLPTKYWRFVSKLSSSAIGWKNWSHISPNRHFLNIFDANLYSGFLVAQVNHNHISFIAYTDWPDETFLKIFVGINVLSCKLCTEISDFKRW